MTMRMTANSRWDNQLEEIRRRVDQRQFWQDVATKQVAPDMLERNAGENGDSPGESLTNSCADNEVRTNTPRTENSIPRNTLASKELCEFKWQKSERSQMRKAETRFHLPNSCAFRNSTWSAESVSPCNSLPSSC
jgi:hypothetical protein